MYLVFARKYRPQRFEEVVGQEHVARTLQNAVRTGRVAHAYLFCGPRGVGKTTMARLLARALNCAEGPTPEPCGRCEACRRIAAGDDVDVLEIDGASNRGIEHVRELRQNARLVPSHGRFKIYYIDEVHMLTPEAFNALLKTLEEPPPHVKFIFSTTDPQRVPETVRSRCQRFDFRRLADAQIVRQLERVCAEEGIECEDGVLPLLARAARGSMRDALGMLDQLAALGERVSVQTALEALGAADPALLERLVDAVAAEDTAGALQALHEALNAGADVESLAEQLAEYLRDLLVAALRGETDALVAGSAAGPEVLARQKGLFGTEQLLYMIQLLREARLRARRETTGRIALELAVVKISRLSDLVPLQEALGRIESGAPAPPQGPAQPPSQHASPSPVGAIQRLKERLKKGPGNPAAPAPAPAVAPPVSAPPPARESPPAKRRTAEPPAGLSQQHYRELLACVGDPRLVEEAFSDERLAAAYQAGQQYLQLKPISLQRRSTEESEPEQQEGEEESEPELP